jgi:S-adenosyl-L-methionine hydrolase (adenosine-forming)
MRDRRLPRAPIPRRIITLTSDFGLNDSYVAAMKAAVLREHDHVRLIDVTHNVPRHDILCGSITLERAIDGFPAGTVHLAVVDPSVGTDRRLIIAQINGQSIVSPDNGLITWSWRLHGGGDVHEITWRPKKLSWTFHGRDVMAPIAARIARRDELNEFAKPIHDPILLDITPSDPGQPRGQVIHIDHFGNATTNIRHEQLPDPRQLNVKVNRRTVGKLRRTYWDVAPGKPLALIGSSGLLEIAVRDGSASDDLNIRVGDSVMLK